MMLISNQTLIVMWFLNTHVVNLILVIVITLFHEEQTENTKGCSRYATRRRILIKHKM